MFSIIGEQRQKIVGLLIVHITCIDIKTKQDVEPVSWSPAKANFNSVLGLFNQTAQYCCQQEQFHYQNQFPINFKSYLVAELKPLLQFFSVSAQQQGIKKKTNPKSLDSTYEFIIKTNSLKI